MQELLYKVVAQVMHQQYHIVGHAGLAAEWTRLNIRSFDDLAVTVGTYMSVVVVVDCYRTPMNQKHLISPKIFID